MNKSYTGRRIAIFSGAYSLLEPMEAIIRDMEELGITEIYSLGNNLGFGPNPSEVIDMLDCYNIKSVIGNFETYYTLGVKTCDILSKNDLLKNREWAIVKLGERRLEYIRQFPYSYDLILGGKRVGICSFANDIRIDSEFYNIDTYLGNLKEEGFYQQFLYTNSSSHKESIKYNIERFSYNKDLTSAYISARDYPIFEGKNVTWYDAIIQGSSTKDKQEIGNNTTFYTIRSILSQTDIFSDKAFYIILHERSDNKGFDIEKRHVLFDRNSMIESILKSDEPTKKIRKLIQKNK